MRALITPPPAGVLDPRELTDESDDNASNRSHSSLSIVIAAIAKLSQTAGVAVVTIAGGFGLIWLSSHAGSPGSEDPPDSGSWCEPR